MRNEEPRRGSDGKLYPRLRVCKKNTTYKPWHVEKLYGPPPYAHRDLLTEVYDVDDAWELAGQHLDEGVAAAKKTAALKQWSKVPTPHEMLVRR